MKIFETKQHCFDHYLQKQKSEILDYALQCFDKIKQLNSELAAAHARIAELERCVVMGGDGKPIKLGEERFVMGGDLTVKSFFADQIYKDVRGAVPVVANADETERWYVDCTYSSPDSVPEGDK